MTRSNLQHNRRFANTLNPMIRIWPDAEFVACFCLNYLVSNGHARPPGYNMPKLGTLAMILQTKRLTWIYRQYFHRCRFVMRELTKASPWAIFSEGLHRVEV